ncbi:MAG: hypothetical protein ABI874_02290, partial [Chloroflexota bacterium]
MSVNASRRRIQRHCHCEPKAKQSPLRDVEMALPSARHDNQNDVSAKRALYHKRCAGWCGMSNV